MTTHISNFLPIATQTDDNNRKRNEEVVQITASTEEVNQSYFNSICLANRYVFDFVIHGNKLTGP